MRLTLTIAAGVFLGLVAFCFLIALAIETNQRHAVEEANAAVAEMSRQAVISKQAFEHQQAVANDRAQFAAAERSRLLQLQGSEQCLGGTIMRYNVVGNTPTVTQLLEGGRPVKCSGNVRLSLPQQ